MTHVGKWYATKDGITIASGGTLTIASGGTLAATGYVASTGNLTNIRATGTGEVNGNFGVGTHGSMEFSVTGATGATTALSLALSKSTAATALSVNTDKFTVEGSTGNTVVAGTTTVAGVTTVGGAKKLILDPGGATATPAANCVQLYFDGTDLMATNSAGKNAKLSASWA
jgi:hypothetical protein